jgi:hypothetical protein
MPFDPRTIEAQLALNLIGAIDMPRLAWDALEAGFDGPAIRRMASFESPTFFQVSEVLPRMMQELHLSKMTAGQAALRLARSKAQEILASKSDPLLHVRAFEQLWRSAGYCAELTDIGNLVDDVHIAECCGKTKEEIHAWLIEILRALANGEEQSASLRFNLRSPG